jgi:hypothetical protein
MGLGRGAARPGLAGNEGSASARGGTALSNGDEELCTGTERAGTPG